MLNPRLVAILAMILAAAATRLLPHPQNLTAIGAMALFGGAYFQRRWLAVVVTLAAMLLSDVALSLTIYSQYGFSWSPVTYAFMALTVGLGSLLRDRISVGRVAGAAILTGVLFFFVSNFFVWLGGTMYPRDLAGLRACYIAGLPYAINTLAGNLIYSAVLFGGMEALQRSWPALRRRPALTAPAGP